jgi:hypothetical protein
MENAEAIEQITAQPASAIRAAAPPTTLSAPSVSAPLTQGCPTCGAVSAANGATAPSYVYAIGRIGPVIPSKWVEKEIMQVIGRTDTASLTDRQALHKVLSQRANRYLARQLCWVMTIEGLETYILMPRDPSDLDLLIEAVRATPNPSDLDVVIGTRGPIAPPEMCNGLMVPIVVFDQIYSFDREQLIKSIPKPEKIAAKEFNAAAEELFDRIMQMADNAGATDEHRAACYCSVRVDCIYKIAAEAFGRNLSLTAVQVTPSPLSGVHKVMDVIQTYTHRTTGVPEKYFLSVDVTGEFPFLARTCSPYYDR